MSGDTENNSTVVSGAISPMRDSVEKEELMKTIRIIAVAMLSASMLVACSSDFSIPADASQPNLPAYSVLDRFDGPDGYITLFCRNGDLFVDKNGVQSGSVQFFYKHEKCAGR